MNCHERYGQIVMIKFMLELRGQELKATSRLPAANNTQENAEDDEDLDAVSFAFVLKPHHDAKVAYLDRTGFYGRTNVDCVKQ